MIFMQYNFLHQQQKVMNMLHQLPNLESIIHHIIHLLIYLYLIVYDIIPVELNDSVHQLVNQICLFIYLNKMFFFF